MITGEMKNKVDRLWEMFWTGGLTNPLDVIEQVTYLMFIRDLDEADMSKAKDSEKIGIPMESIFPPDKPQLRWSKLQDYSAPQMYKVMQEEIFPFIKNLHGDKGSTYSKYMEDAIFKIPTPALLEKIVTALNELETKDRENKGDLYEYLLSKIATAGRNGQFRTPRHIIQMMVELADLQPEDTICDPACGTSGFLVEAGKFVRKEYEAKGLFHDKKLKDHFHNQMFWGYDMDRTMLRIGAMNLMTHGIENPNILYKDSLSEQNEDQDKFTKILANPPFKGSLDYGIVAPDLLKITKTKKTELLFLTLFLRMLKQNGRCVSILPDGVLFGSSNAHKAIRKEIIENHKLEAIISMPSGVFKPYAGVSTAVMIFKKTGFGGTDKVWFYDMKNDGFSLDDKRSPIEGSDLPDIVARFKNIKAEENRSRKDQSFLVPKADIVANDYDLSINKYKEMDYEEEVYPHPKEIIAEIQQLESQIQQGLKDLEGMIGE